MPNSKLLMSDALIAAATLNEGRIEPVFATDPQARIVYINSAARELTGWDHPQQRVLTEVVRLRDSAPLVSFDDQEQSTAWMRTFATGAMTVRNRDGQECEFDGQGIPVYGASGTVEGMVLALRNRELQEPLFGDPGRMLKLVMDNIPQLLFWKDKSSVYRGCNRNFARIVGLERPDDIVGKTDADLLWPKGMAEFLRARDHRVMTTGMAEQHIAESQQQADGSLTWVDASVIPLRATDGTVMGVLGTYEDITERRQLEEQLRQAQKMKAVGQLAGGVAHDFNNLLTAIVIHAELARTAMATDHPAYADLEEVMRAAARAADVTRQLLTFSRKRVVQRRLIAVNDVILSVHSMLRPLIRENTEMVTLLSAAGKIAMDPGEIEQVIVNLAVNGASAMPEGGKLTIETYEVVMGEDVEITANTDVPAGTYVGIRVHDTGVGMSPEVKERIFEPFFTTKNPGEGTGLGLAIVYGIVTRANGHITVDSTPGRGTTFDILLPLVEGEAVDSASGTTESHAQARPRGGETILLVEDDTSVRRLAARILRDLGYTVVESSNGEEALRVAVRHGIDTIDLILADVVMPVMGGVEMVDRLLPLRPTLRVVFMSGYTGTTGLDRFVSSEASFLYKPFTIESLAQKVRDVLDGVDTSPTGGNSPIPTNHF